MNGSEPIRPSLWYAAMAIPILLAALLIMGLIVASDFGRVRNSMAYADVPGEMNVNLKRNLHYTIFLEQINDGPIRPDSSTPAASNVFCGLRHLQYGTEIPLHRPAGSTTFNYGNSSGFALLEFDVPRDGVYLLGCQDLRTKPGPKLRVAVGAGAASAVAWAILKAVIVLFAGGIIALLIFVRVLMLRDQSKREIRARGLKPV
ncbi:MAG TPA: hypothetical protein VLX60_00475 [Terriglobales bacterium]|nr:hypothetical protein [Terriglobales bacterium]